MHVDDASDELHDKQKMESIEAQHEALRKMHIDHILNKEEFINKLRDFGAVADSFRVPIVIEIQSGK